MKNRGYLLYNFQGFSPEHMKANICPIPDLRPRQSIPVSDGALLSTPPDPLGTLFPYLGEQVTDDRLRKCSPIQSILLPLISTELIDQVYLLFDPVKILGEMLFQEYK